MRIEKYFDDRINYQESCFIVNAMNYYVANFMKETKTSKETQTYYNNIIEKYIKLENKILELRIDKK